MRLMIGDGKKLHFPGEEVLQIRSINNTILHLISGICQEYSA